MRRLIEYYCFVGLMGVTAAYTLFVVLLPLPVQSVTAVQPIKISPSAARTVGARSGIPVRLSVPSLGIDTPVKVGNFDASKGVWTLSDTDVFYADTSVPANNNNGVTLLYGHARWGVFGILPDVAPNAAADIYTDNGLHFQYRFASVREVLPSDVSIFTQQGSPKLVLQTCTGLWDNFRALYLFEFIGEV